MSTAQPSSFVPRRNHDVCSFNPALSTNCDW
jgi:hypothetical protein